MYNSIRKILINYINIFSQPEDQPEYIISNFTDISNSCAITDEDHEKIPFDVKDDSKGENQLSTFVNYYK